MSVCRAIFELSRGDWGCHDLVAIECHFPPYARPTALRDPQRIATPVEVGARDRGLDVDSWTRHSTSLIELPRKSNKVDKIEQAAHHGQPAANSPRVGVAADLAQQLFVAHRLFPAG